jgi:hypothetical protein
LRSSIFSADDLRDLAARGISVEAAEQQLGHYASPPAPACLVRPCAPGDGIRCLTSEQASGYAARYQEQARLLAISKFVPASGAASRMFRSLLSADAFLRTRADFEARAADGDGDAKAVMV